MSWIVPDEALVSSPAVYMLVAMAATLLVGFSKGGFGGGVGVLATPILLLVLPGAVAISLILPILIVCDVFTLRHFPVHWDKRSYWLLLSGTWLGFGVGLASLVWFTSEGDKAAGEWWIRLVVGVVSLLFCGLKAVDPVLKKALQATREKKPFRPGWGSGLAMGLVAGFTTTIAHAAGPIVSMFLLPQDMSPKKFVGTCARYFLTVNVAKVPLYVLAGYLAGRDFITFQTLKWDLWLLPFCPIGVAAGAWFNHRLSGRVFTAIVYILLGLTGVKMIADVIQG